MTELTKEGWAIHIDDPTDAVFGRKLVAVLSDEWEARQYMAHRYPHTVNPELIHVWFGVEGW